VAPGSRLNEESEMLTCRSRVTIALWGGIASVLLLTAPARAQEICGGDLAGLPDQILDLYLEQLTQEPGVGLEDEDFCSKLTQNFVKACQTAAKDSTRCELALVSALDAQNREGCKVFVTPAEVKDCMNSFKTTAKTAKSELTSQRMELESECEDLADAFFDVCMFGF
jgi:hypothetical protein